MRAPRRGDYMHGFAPRDFRPAYPELWRGCVGAWCPSLGPTGSTLLDWSGRKNHGVLTNLTLATAWAMNQGNSLLINVGSTRDCVNFGNVGYIANDMTVAAWVYKNSNTSGFTNIWTVNRWNTTGSAGTNEFSLCHGNANTGTDNKPLFGIEVGTTAYNIAAASALSLFQWYHLCGVRRGSQIEIWVNGNLDGTTTGVSTSAITNRSRNLKLGDSDIASDLATNAYFDDLCLYDRALDAKEIKLRASRRGIAYEWRPPARSSPQATTFQAYWASRKSRIIGGGQGV